MRSVCALSVALVVTASAALAGDCACKADKAHDGWCKECKVGYVDGVKITSKKLYAALQGKAVDADHIKCPGCKAALAKNGTCGHCHIEFAANHAYASPVAYHLAMGKLMTSCSADMKCEGCKKAADGECGWCDHCKAGIVGNRIFTDKTEYEQAVAAHALLVKASETAKHCEGCGVAMVTNGTCEACKVTYKDGKVAKG